MAAIATGRALTAAGTGIDTVKHLSVTLITSRNRRARVFALGVFSLAFIVTFVGQRFGTRINIRDFKRNLSSTYGQSVIVEVVLLTVALDIVMAVVVDGTVELVPDAVGNGVCISMTPGRMFTLAMVIIPAMHIAISMTNQMNSL